MQYIYPFIISFIMVFIAELGDKTQLIVLSFSNSLKPKNILLGVAIGSLFSHGIAILFGSKIGLLENAFLHNLIEIITYSSYSLIIALSIIVGELGDKTFLASVGFGIEYPNSKILLILGAILGMVVSDSLAIIFGKLLNKYISETTMQKISGILFIIFGLIGFIM